MVVKQIEKKITFQKSKKCLQTNAREKTSPIIVFLLPYPSRFLCLISEEVTKKPWWLMLV